MLVEGYKKIPLVSITVLNNYPVLPATNAEICYQLQETISPILSPPIYGCGKDSGLDTPSLTNSWYSLHFRHFDSRWLRQILPSRFLPFARCISAEWIRVVMDAIFRVRKNISIPHKCNVSFLSFDQDLGKIFSKASEIQNITTTEKLVIFDVRDTKIVYRGINYVLNTACWIFLMVIDPQIANCIIFSLQLRINSSMFIYT